MTQELLEIIWGLEATINKFPQLKALLNSVLQNPVFHADEFPEPTEEERRPPTIIDDDEAQQPELPK